MCSVDMGDVDGHSAAGVGDAAKMSVLLAQIAELEAESFTDAWSVSALKAALSYDYNMLFAARQTAGGHIEVDLYQGLPENFAGMYSGETAGYLIANLLADESELLRIAVGRSLRGRGVGDRLMKAYRDALRDCCGRYLLEVRAGNAAARRLYEKWDYRPIHVRKNYYSNPTEAAVIYECIPERTSGKVF